MQTIALNALLFAIAILVIWILRTVIFRVVNGPVKRMITQSDNQYDDALLKAIQRPMRLAVMGIGIAIVTAFFEFGGNIEHFADSLARSLIVFALIFAIYNMVDIIAITSDNLSRVTGLQIQDRLLPFLRTVTKVIILILGGFIVVQEFGYDVTGLVASFGVVGLAFSLAAQDTAANVFGFAAIVSDNPFEVGDFIVTSDVTGIVENVGVRSTRIRRIDQALISVPNSTLTNAAVTNWSRLEKRRFDKVIGLTYDTTAPQMRYFLDRVRDMLKERTHIDEESVVVHFVEFGGSSLDVRIICSILLPDWGAFTAETELINLELMELVEELGLGFAFPSMSMYVESMPSEQDEKSAPRVPAKYYRKGQELDAEQIHSEMPDQNSDGG